MWGCTGEVGTALPWSGLLSRVLKCCKHRSLVLTGLSSSELVNTKWQQTGLWLLNLQGECTECCSAVVW